MAKTFLAAIVSCLSLVTASDGAVSPEDFRTGRAQHAFDHLGGIGEQAEAAAASGSNVIYATGVGGIGYAGLPAEAELAAVTRAAAAYNASARAKGIRVILGYACATSIVYLDTFDKNWTPAFRAKFQTPPAEWRQQDKAGKPLPSWYGGNYNPACMNNPDWREYEKFVVAQQIECGHDGIFFDNPTVHSQGCYCPHCMKKFSAMLVSEAVIRADVSVEAARALAEQHPAHFLRFRGTTGRDFLAAMREHARSVRPDALMTCNNSLNSPETLYAQCRTHAYNIYEMSRAEDLVVVEDMATQPRMLAGGRTVEYGPTLAQLHAVSRGKPVVANVLADADNHTPPNLVRLAMAEAAAHDASYLSWPTWPEVQRERMIKTIRPQADLQRENAALLNDTQPRRDVILFLPFRRWVDTPRCVASELATKLTAANVQYAVASEDDLAATLQREAARDTTAGSAAGRRTAPGMAVRQVFLVESRAVLVPEEKAALEKYEASGALIVAADEGDWVKSIEAAIRPSVELRAPATVRAVVRDQKARSVVHLYNLAVEKLSSFEDKVHPVSDVTLRVRVPFVEVKSVKAVSADVGVTTGTLPFTVGGTGSDVFVEVKLPSLHISTLLVLEP